MYVNDLFMRRYSSFPIYLTLYCILSIVKTITENIIVHKRSLT